MVLSSARVFGLFRYTVPAYVPNGFDTLSPNSGTYGVLSRCGRAVPVPVRCWGLLLYPFATEATRQYFSCLREFGGRPNTRDMSPGKGKAKEIPGVSTLSLPTRTRRPCPSGSVSGTNLLSPANVCIATKSHNERRSTSLGSVWSISSCSVVVSSVRVRGRVSFLQSATKNRLWIVCVGTRSRDEVGSSSSSPSSLLGRDEGDEFEER